MIEKFIDKKLSENKLRLITQANSILHEYQSNGYVVTLRQLYYQFVARAWLPNEQKYYKRLSETVSDGRLVGLIPWDAIVDRTRSLKGVRTWGSPSSAIESVHSQYREDLWDNQNCRVEVWVEKDALMEVIANACIPYQVNYFSCRGFTSQTAMYDASKRVEYESHEGKVTHIIHLGDHDPSGIDMSRDIEDRTGMFLGMKDYPINRIALNMNQVKKFKPPPNPVKLKDSRAKGYTEKHGKESWELDALEPSVLHELIQDNIKKLLDTRKWNARLKQVERNKKKLKKLSDLARSGKNWKVVEPKKRGKKSDK